MKKFLAYSAISFLGFLPIKAAFADILNVTFDGTNYTVQRYNTSTGSATDLKSFTSPYGTCAGCTFVDEYEGKLYLGGGSGWAIYDIESNSVELVDKPSGSLIQTVMPWSGNTAIKKNNDGTIQIGTDTNDIDVVSDGLNIDGAAVITKNSDGSVQIGADGNDIDITAEGLTVDGVSLITKKESGEIHIGKNSLITIEEDGVQKLYAKDENNNTIDINVTNNSKLLIDGVEVKAGDSAQVTTNKNNISSNDTEIASNASSISTNSSNISSNDTDISALQGLISTKSGSTTTARIGDSTKNTLEIGPTTNPTTINQSGISVSGGNLIKKDSDGNIHIGKNSFVIGDDVLNGAHPIWAEDENGTKIPLNIYGSDLHINGKSVQGQIDSNKSNIKNIGEGVAGSTALTAALTALPQTSKESKLSCGVGSGAYSSRYAVGFGCASKVNERVDINAGGSYVFGGSKSYGEGTLDSGVIKAGFVFKLGELNKPTLISMHEKEKMEDKIFSLEEKNEKIISQNEDLKNKNQSIIAQNKSLLARLERLEKLARIETKSKDLATIKLP